MNTYTINGKLSLTRTKNSINGNPNFKGVIWSDGIGTEVFTQNDHSVNYFLDAYQDKYCTLTLKTRYGRETIQGIAPATKPSQLVESIYQLLQVLAQCNNAGSYGYNGQLNNDLPPWTADKESTYGHIRAALVSLGRAGREAYWAFTEQGELLDRDQIADIHNTWLTEIDSNN